MTSVHSAAALTCDHLNPSQATAVTDGAEKGSNQMSLLDAVIGHFSFYPWFNEVMEKLEGL